MHLKEIVTEHDTPSALYFWLYWYYCRIGTRAEETEINLRLGHGINVTLTDHETPLGLKITVEWDSRPCALEVHMSHLCKLAEDKYQHAVADLALRHHGILCVPDVPNLAFY